MMAGSTMKYAEFIASKSRIQKPVGFEPSDLNSRLFDWQADIVRMACLRGRFGGFEDCGLGKSFQQLECAKQIVKHTGGDVLILAPLAVSHQTKREAAKFEIDCDVHVCRTADDVRQGINVTNYERMHAFDPSLFDGIILDEGSILKSVDGKTRNECIRRFADTPYRQTWTATPAPNDFMEIANQAEFLGVMSRSEMLSTWFVHDGGETAKWRLKGHGRDRFWEWMASWCVVLRDPQGIGYGDCGYQLPPLRLHEHSVESPASEGYLWAQDVTTIHQRREAKRATINERCKVVADLVNKSSEPWVVWCNLNDEGKRLDAVIPDAVEVAGYHDMETKEQRLRDFTEGNIRVLITKPKIGGFGLNWQHCPNTAIFPTDSFEQWYQMIRRFWRFGQKRAVHVHAVYSDAESVVFDNVRCKERAADEMFAGIADAMRSMTESQLHGTRRDVDIYEASENMEIPHWIA